MWYNVSVNDSVDKHYQLNQFSFQSALQSTVIFIHHF